MRGLDYIAQMRRLGFKPSYVTLQPLSYEKELLPLWVKYEPGDMPETHDLRPFVGLFVTVMGDDAELVDRWVKAAMKAGAHTVMSHLYTDPVKASEVWREHRLYGLDL